MRLDERRVVDEIRSKLTKIGYDVTFEKQELPVDIFAKGADRIILVEVTSAPRVVLPQVMALASGSDFARTIEDRTVHPILVYSGEIDNQAKEFAHKSGVTVLQFPAQGGLDPIRFTLTSKEAYARILAWHKKNSSKIGNRGSENYRRDYFAYLNSVPDAEEASSSDMKRMSHEVLMGLLEWAFHERDETGVELNQYARVIKDELGE
jgi:hypothetical protein